MRKSLMLIASSNVLILLMFLFTFASVIDAGENESYYNQDSGVPPPHSGALPVSMPVAELFARGSQDWINQQRNEQKWGEISYIYWTIPNETVYAPTIVAKDPYQYDPSREAKSIYNMISHTTQTNSKDSVFRINATRELTAVNSDQRKLIAEQFPNVSENTNKIKLPDLLVLKYTSHSEDFMTRIVEEPQRLDAFYLHDALTGRKDTKDLIEFATTRSNRQYNMLKKTYLQMYYTNLDTAIMEATKLSGKLLNSSTKEGNSYQALLLKIFGGERDEYNLYNENFIVKYSLYTAFVHYGAVNPVLVTQDVTELMQSPSPQVYSKILGRRSYAHIRAIKDSLATKHTSLDSLVNDRFKDNYKLLLLTISKVSSDMTGFFAERIEEALNANIFKGGLDDNDFIRYLASRAQIDLAAIIPKVVIKGNPLLKAACKEREINSNPEYKDGVIAFIMGNDPIKGYAAKGYRGNAELPKECKK
ncbi:annexin A6 [Ditylenchus destructor]|nr:annexin A6 [Ditylenchus destructor]